MSQEKESDIQYIITMTDQQFIYFFAVTGQMK
jgi:hypothetical protein